MAFAVKLPRPYEELREQGLADYIA